MEIVNTGDKASSGIFVNRQVFMQIGQGFASVVLSRHHRRVFTKPPAALFGK